MENRKFERVPLRETVMVEGYGFDAMVATAADLSLGGMFIEGAYAAFGAHVTLRLRLDGEGLVLPAIVRWVRSDGIGVQFGLLGARETYAITETVARAAPSRTRERAVPAADSIDIEITLDDDVPAAPVRRRHA